MNLKAIVAAAILTLVAVFAIAPAEARRAPHSAASTDWMSSNFSFFDVESKTARGKAHTRARANTHSSSRRHAASSTSLFGLEALEQRSRSGIGGRPGQWCGWYMRTRHGGGPEMNLARNWMRYGSSASPQVGAIVVWSHHVGEIVGQAANGQWIVLSGNDGGRVRQRARSIAGAVVRI